MPRILLASDSPAIRSEIRTVIADGETSIIEIDQGHDVVKLARTQPLDLAILDMQMGTMGGVATCLELRLEESGGRLGHIPVLLLLDRRADVFLARRSDAEGWIVKPLDAIRIRHAVGALLRGETFHDETFAPSPKLVGNS